MILVSVQEKSAIFSDSLKRIRDAYEGVLTGKGLTYGGFFVRTQATGYGLLYLTEELLKINGKELAGKTVAAYPEPEMWQLMLLKRRTS